MFDTLESCRDNMHRIQSALSNFHNGRSGPVFGKDKQGQWRKLRSAWCEKSIPYGTPADDSADFVLRAVEVREK